MSEDHRRGAASASSIGSRVSRPLIKFRDNIKIDSHLAGCRSCQVMWCVWGIVAGGWR
jgi:hypothetical protein